MTDAEFKILEKKAQIKILAYLPNHLCNSELSEKGRKALIGITNRLNDEIDDLSTTETKITDSRNNRDR